MTSLSRIFRLRRLLVFVGLICLSFVVAGVAADDRWIPPVYLNHLYVVVDHDTYQSIGQSEFITNEFASFRKTNVQAAGGESWSGTYLMGEHTYVEMFEPSEAPGVSGEKQFKLHQSGIGLSADIGGAIDKIQEGMRKNFGDKVKRQMRIRQVDQREIPWFHIVDVTGPQTNALFSSWYMEYDKDYARTRYPDIRPEEDGISRKQYLMRSFQNDRYLRDIVEVTFALAEPEIAKFVAELAGVGFKIVRKGELTECIGPDIKIILMSATADVRGVTKLKMTLMKGKRIAKPLRFGP